MSKCLAAITGALAVLAVSVLASYPAQAGGSSSAPSKYGHSSQVAAVQQVQTRPARSTDFGITEYSSSAKNPHRAHGYR